MRASETTRRSATSERMRFIFFSLNHVKCFFVSGTNFKFVYSISLFFDKVKSGTAFHGVFFWADIDKEKESPVSLFVKKRRTILFGAKVYHV